MSTTNANGPPPFGHADNATRARPPGKAWSLKTTHRMKTHPIIQIVEFRIVLNPLRYGARPPCHSHLHRG
eukprot:1807267-Lingulodinium_polyedra.AAC.1